MAIYFKILGKFGRLGNQLFEHAFIYSLSKKYNCKYFTPKWKFSEYFNYYPDEDKGITTDITINEPVFHYAPEYYDNYAKFYDKENINIAGYFQSYKYFSSKEDILNIFKFNESFKKSVYQRTKHLLDKPIVIMHIRHGDYIGNANYINLSRNYYIRCMKCFDNNSRFVVLTDDYERSKQMLKGLEVDLSLEGMSDIEHLCFGACFGNHFILCNSTFGWWMAYLNQDKYKIVYRPEKIFSGKLAQRHDEKDFWPPEWLIQTDEAFKYDFRDVTFVIPLRNDSQDRVENLNLTIKFIRANFDTNIIIGEQETHDFEGKGDQYIFYPYKYFHRTKMLNEMIFASKTPIVINWDADVFVNPEQLNEAVKLIRKGEYDIVYPYDGTFVRMGRCFYGELNDDIFKFNSYYAIYHNMSWNGRISFGGAIVMNKDKFFEAGGENENFITHAPEDAERYYRFTTLGLRIKRIDGNIYHLDHWVGEDSTHNNEFKLINRSELNRVKSMNQEQLRQYVKGWSWRH